MTGKTIKHFVHQPWDGVLIIFTDDTKVLIRHEDDGVLSGPYTNLKTDFDIIDCGFDLVGKGIMTKEEYDAKLTEKFKAHQEEIKKYELERLAYLKEKYE